MTTRGLLLGLALTGLSISISVTAHNPSEHAAATEEPDCSAMRPAGGGEIDMDSPVWQAMLKQCIGAIHGDDGSPDMNHEEGDYDEGGGKSDLHQHSKDQASGAS